MESISPGNCRIDPVDSLYKIRTTVDVLRLDLIHPVVSGNKWFKLKYYLQDALELQKKMILSFGGAYSNHIVAIASASRSAGLKSIGLIRGEKPPVLSHTLLTAAELGMELFFLPRDEYRQKSIPSRMFELYDPNDVYVINEGGYGCKGMEGAMEILATVPTEKYSHIIGSTGTGTMLAGLVKASSEHQHVIGVSALKNNFSAKAEINHLLQEPADFTLLHDYHFGGYAKYNEELIDFMNKWWIMTGIPSDFVYTGKLFFAVHDLISKNYFPENSRILAIHSGGLQGNLSLMKGKLIF